MRDVPTDELKAQLGVVVNVVQRIVPHVTRFAGQRILFTGREPYSVEELSSILPPSVRRYDDLQVEQVRGFDLVVVGQSGWKATSIDAALANSDPPPRFLPQEGFLDELLFGNNWWKVRVDRLNGALAYYPGLRYVKAMETFRWPSTEAPESQGNGEPGAFALETRLHALGYQISDRTRAQRWSTVTREALPRLGLQETAETIANLVRLRKAQVGGREKYSYAIAEWEHDLSRLWREHYPSHGRRFIWPSTEP